MVCYERAPVVDRSRGRTGRSLNAESAASNAKKEDIPSDGVSVDTENGEPGSDRVQKDPNVSEGAVVKADIAPMINRVLNDSQKEELLLISHEIGGGSEFSTRSEKELAAISESSLGKRVLFGGDEEGQDLKKLRASVDCQSNVSAVEEETYS
ncbi:hypothetical protein ACOSQ2_033029 [Xanthoceras sorbifolium]